MFLRVVRGSERYEDRLRERVWVFRIARNVVLDGHRRTRRVRPALSLEAAEDVAAVERGVLTALRDRTVSLVLTSRTIE